MNWVQSGGELDLRQVALVVFGWWDGQQLFFYFWFPSSLSQHVFSL